MKLKFFLSSQHADYYEAQPNSCPTRQDMQPISVTQKDLLYPLTITTPHSIFVTFRNLLLSSTIRNPNKANKNAVTINQHAWFKFCILEDILRNSNELEINSI
jgi:hypothetical protein